VSITTIIIGAGLMVQAFNAAHMIPAALIVFGGSLILGGAIAARGFWRQPRPPFRAPMDVGHPGSEAISGLEILVGLAAAILGILTLILVGPDAGFRDRIGFSPCTEGEPGN
jgi:hypothetical protein